MKSVSIWRLGSKSKSSFVWGLALAAFFMLPAMNLIAQMDQGIIGGVVQDKTGAVIPGAQVTLTNTDTGITLESKTNGSGIYVFPPESVGNYKLTVTSAGFRTLTQENIHLDVQARLSFVLVLQPGAVSQTILVNSLPPLLQTQDASVGQVMSTETVSNTPLNGRNWVYIAQMAAGVDPSHGSRAQGTGDFYANGQQATQNNFVLNGGDNNSYAPDYLNGSSFNLLPPPDALSEFKIETGDYSAEFGHSAGGVVNASIQSGTNQIHGDIWEYVRNNDLDARDFDATTVPNYHENQFGATLGLPIIKNKLFFFGYAEANRILFAETGTYTVPTALMRQGNFTELMNPSLTGDASPVTLYQPGSAGTTPLACNGQQNVICPAQIDSVAKNLLSYFPLPNTNGGKTYSNYVYSSNARSNTWQWGGRSDWNISQHDQAFASFSYEHIPSYYNPPLGPILDGGAYGTDGSVTNLAESFVFSETHIFSPKLFNSVRYGYSYGNYKFLQPPFAQANFAESLGLGGVPYSSSLGGGTPELSVGGLSSFGTTTYFPAGKHSNEYQILDDATLIVGNHSLKFGVAFQSVRLNVYSTGASHGAYSFTGLYTEHPGTAFTGSGVADFLLDQMDSASLESSTQFHMSRWYDSAYVEDQWKARGNLTLNIGLRYDYFQASKELNNELGGLYFTGPITPGHSQGVLTYPTQKTPLTLTPAFLNALSESNVSVQYSNNPTLVNTPKLDFGPRFGLAYMLNQHTVIRMGYGLFFAQDVQLSDSPEYNFPFSYTSGFPAPSTCVPGNCLTNGITLEDGFTQEIAAGLINSVENPSFNTVLKNESPTYAQDYNLTVQRAITPNITASIGYVGTADRHLGLQPNFNSPAALTDPRLSSILAEPFPLLGGMTFAELTGESSYNSLQTELQKRFEHGLSFLATYTWAHALDDAPEPLGSTGDSGLRAPNMIPESADYGNAPSDVRHRFTFMGLYNLPFGLGRTYLNRRGIVNEVAGGWSTDLTFVAQTGQPFTVGTDLGSSGPNGGSANAILIRNPYATGGAPDPSNPGVTCAQRTRTLQHWYNPCAFANPPIAFPQAQVAGSPISTTQFVGLAALPYLGGVRDTMHGPGYERVNMSLFKDFRTFHEQRLEFRADIFNVLNTPAYGSPSSTSDSSSGGAITGPRTFQNFTPDARFFQLSARYRF